MKERDFAVDIVKFIAVFLIINSHADMMYPRMSILATGGAIGDCLFLFVSGYTLFLGGMRSFDNYYKRRICRIYPSVFMALIFTHLVRKEYTMEFHELWGGEFIRAIMIYYAIIYCIRKYAFNYIWWIVGAIGIATLAVYVFWFPYKYETSARGIYGILTPFRWLPYFAFMLTGAITGMRSKTIQGEGWFDFIKMICCLAVFYGIQFMAKTYPAIAPLQIITLLPLVGIIFYLYKWCKSKTFYFIYQHKIMGKLIACVAGLCLESYLIQYSLFTDKMNGIWPLNLIIITIIILLCSYLVRCGARLFMQTFRTEDYNWKDIVKL